MTTVREGDYIDGYNWLIDELGKVLKEMEAGDLYKAEDIFERLQEIHPYW
jgi:soluble cytochrome b562